MRLALKSDQGPKMPKSVAQLRHHWRGNLPLRATISIGEPLEAHSVNTACDHYSRATQNPEIVFPVKGLQLEPI